MAKMGRPKADTLKDHIVTVRMSHEEHAKLKEFSEKHRQTMTQTIKSGVELLYKAGKS